MAGESMIAAYPLQWPAGWKRTESWCRERGRFARKGSAGYLSKVTIADSVERVLDELQRMGIGRDDVVISSNVPSRLDGLPRSDARNPSDPGAAVYWKTKTATRCMAIDRYQDVAANLAAIAATLEAMRAIERHGGAEVLDRAFTGFVALPAPKSDRWFEVLEVSETADAGTIEAAFRRKAMQAHPDRGGSHDDMARLNAAREQGLRVAGRA